MAQVLRTCIGWLHWCKMMLPVRGDMRPTSFAVPMTKIFEPRAVRCSRLELLKRTRFLPKARGVNGTV